MNLTDKILMVRPNTFRSNEQTIINNYFQKNNSKIDNKDVLSKALKEFDDLINIISKNKIEITVVKGNKLNDNPDEIFPNNWIVFENNKIGIFPMNALNRRTEINYDLIKKINKKNNYKIFDYSNHAKKNIFLEGTGSVVLDRTNKKAYCGLSERSSKNLFLKFCIDFDYKPIMFHAYHNVNEKRKLIYHTNVMMSIGANNCFICLDSIDDVRERKNVKANIENDNNLIELSELQINEFAGNVIFLKSTAGDTQIVMSKSAYNSFNKSQISEIEKIGNIIYSPIPTIEKHSGGSVRCMIAEIF
ncbi:MAG: amidinotransferase [Flavobacteriaceae bacterium]|nr:amidinotransferase [Flavobacteriaceae bacterium]|tara:strand:- start:7945 stop:8853 length:909 start_codon:yes stop_codon:yes gene_type:complete